MTELKPLNIEKIDNFHMKAKCPHMNKNNNLSDYLTQLYSGDYNVVNAIIENVVLLEKFDFNNFSNHLLSDYDFLTVGGCSIDKNEKDKYYTHCSLVVNEEGIGFLVDTQGYSYARYCLFPIHNPMLIENLEEIAPETFKAIQDKKEKDAEEAAEINEFYNRAYYS